MLPKSMSAHTCKGPNIVSALPNELTNIWSTLGEKKRKRGLVILNVIANTKENIEYQ